ncbi:hypothetical protein PI20285_04935 [Pediococcus inopinatus]|nr:hypothetical protein PI20285_04935 [Pediococcus inopinatus]
MRSSGYNSNCCEGGINLKILKKVNNQGFGNNVLFINASENVTGNTSKLGNKLLKGNKYRQLNLVDYKIYQIGQKFSDDQFNDVLGVIEQSETVILGTPVYWHTMSGYLKTLLERLSQDSDKDALHDKSIGVFVQGSSPSDTIEPTNSIIKTFARVAGMKYIEMRY